MPHITKKELIQQYLNNIRTALNEEPAAVYTWIAAIEQLLTVTKTRTNDKRTTKTKRRHA